MNSLSLAIPKGLLEAPVAIITLLASTSPSVVLTNFVSPLLARRELPNVKLENGYGLAIEPMVHMGAKECYTDSNGWSVITRDGSPAAHFEHSVIVNDNSPIILTLRN